jgi:hypothetical protein
LPNRNARTLSSISTKHETDLEDRLRARKTPGSGAKLDKGDLNSREDPLQAHLHGRTTYKYELKATGGKSLAVSLTWLRKITQQAIDTGRVPLLALRFESAKSPVKKDFVVMEMDHFLELVGDET